MSERWVNDNGTIVQFEVDTAGRVLIEREALALLLVAAGFAQEAS